MFFSKPTDHHPQEAGFSPEPVAAAQPQGVKSDRLYAEKILQLGNLMKKRQHFLHVSEYASYPISYLGDMLMFAGRLYSEKMETGGVRSDAGKRWFTNQLPIIMPVPVEIGPRDFMRYLQQAMDTDPLRQIHLEAEVMENLREFIEENIALAQQSAPAAH
jgi:hypothetical protein